MSNVIAITWNALHRIVTITRPFAATDVALDSLTGIHFTTHHTTRTVDGKPVPVTILQAEATDRYALIRARTEIDGPYGLDFIIDAQQLARAIPSLKAIDEDTNTPRNVHISIDTNDRATFEAGSDAPQVTLQLLNNDSLYPSLDHIIRKISQGQPTNTFVNPNVINRLPITANSKLRAIQRAIMLTDQKMIGFFDTWDEWVVVSMGLLKPDNPTEEITNTVEKWLGVA